MSPKGVAPPTNPNVRFERLLLEALDPKRPFGVPATVAGSDPLEALDPKRPFAVGESGLFEVLSPAWCPVAAGVVEVLAVPSSSGRAILGTIMFFAREPLGVLDAESLAPVMDALFFAGRSSLRPLETCAPSPLSPLETRTASPIFATRARSTTTLWNPPPSPPLCTPISTLVPSFP